MSESGTREVLEHKPVATSLPVYGHTSSSPGGLSSPSSVEVKKVAVAKRAPMRSSIACMRCRRSKIKCVNDGEGKSACETCLKSRRDCRYLVSNNQLSTNDAELQFVVTTAPKTPRVMKREDPGQTERNSERKRLKKLGDSVSLDEQKTGAYYANEVLSEHYFTETMWTEIFDIYRLHFSTELPFLHLATLKEKMGDKMRASQTRRSDGTNLVLLGVLTLTARFHSDLVRRITFPHANHSGNKMNSTGTVKSDPWAASEYFAGVLSGALGPLSACVRLATVERVQAFLMLGLYEWIRPSKRDEPNDTGSDGMGAWMYVGFGIRMAEGLKMGVSDEPPRHRRRAATSVPSALPTAAAEAEVDIKADIDTGNGPRSSSTTSPTKAHPSDSYREGTNTATQQISDKRSVTTAIEAIVSSEVRRRTMFSCFVLDRMLACGKNRSTMIRSENIKIQLPCSEIAFDLSFKTFTGFLRPRPEIGKDAAGATVAREVASDINDSLLARFICLVDIWGEISEYSFAGGRHTEERPPWEESEFRRLRGVLEDFYARLPSTFTFSTTNYHKHENHHASTEYVSLHMLGAVCQIMLHREYTPFIPARCMRPMGPLDEPTFPEGSAPLGFWEQSADQMFKAAREIVELIEICQTRKQMPMSALVVFAVWTAAFVGIYAWHFPRMDINHRMSTRHDADRNRKRRTGSDKEDDLQVSTHGPTAIAFDALKGMGMWLQMATTYVKYFHEMDEYYKGVKKEYWAHVGRHSGETARRKSVRQGGNGGGLDEWKVHGPKVTNNGKIFAAEDTFAEGSDLSGEGNKRDEDDVNDNATAEPRAAPAKARSSQLRRIAPAGSSSLVGPDTASGLDRDQQQRQRQHGDVIGEEPTLGDEESAVAAETAVPDDGMHGILYEGEIAVQFPDGNIGDNDDNSGNVSDDILQTVPTQQWDQYAQHPQQQQQQPAQLYVQDPMSQPQTNSSNSSPPEDYLCNDASTNFPFDLFYAPVAGVEPYVNTLEGKRWQDASQAAGIERFSQAELDGPAVWGVSYFGTGFSSADFQS